MRVHIGLGVLVGFVLIWSVIWIRLPRTYRFIARFDGRPIPFPLKTDATTERFRKGASIDTTSYGFKANSKQVEAAMVEELVAAGWTRFESDECSDDFFRGHTRISTYKGLPIQESESMTDFATFISDRTMLNVPPEVTCVAIITNRTNLTELLQRFQQRPKEDNGTD